MAALLVYRFALFGPRGSARNGKQDKDAPPPLRITKARAAVAVVLVLLATAPAQRDPGFVFPAQHKGEIAATLAVRVAEQGPAPGRARVRLTLDVEGPAAVEVEPPRLEDALAGWRVEWAASSWSETDARVAWGQTLGLVQVKPGVVPLPGVTLRVRAGPEASWETMSWPELLLEARDAPPPEKAPPLPPSPWPGRLRIAGAGVALAFGLALLVRAGQRWWSRRHRPLPAHERALNLLDQTPSEATAGVTHVDAVLRDYLQQRFGIQTQRKTNPELLAALAEQKELASEHRAALAELLSCCELLKFAPVGGMERVRAAVELARIFIRATAPVGEARRDAKAQPVGENGRNIEVG